MSWVFLSVLIAWTLSSNTYPSAFPGHSPETYQLMGIATLAGIFFSIIAHEVAHAVIAEYYHMPIDNITLFIFGGVAEMHGDPSHPKGEFLMAVAGPIMSGLLGLFFMAAGELYALHIASGAVTQCLYYLGEINILIAVFNMVPAFPLDGGRALRAIIWRAKDNLVLATRIASELGAVFAYGLMAYACYRIAVFDDLVSGVWIGLLGMILHASGAVAVRQTENRSLLGMETVMRFTHRSTITVPPDITIHDMVEKYVYAHYQRSFPVIDQGRLVGVITLQSILSLDRHKWHWLHVASVMEPISEKTALPPGTNAAFALDAMQRTGKDSFIVAEGEVFHGIVTLRDLTTYLSITMKIDNNKPISVSRKGNG